MDTRYVGPINRSFEYAKYEMALWPYFSENSHEPQTSNVLHRHKTSQDDAIKLEGVINMYTKDQLSQQSPTS